MLGVHSPLSLVNLLHLTLSTTLGMRGGKEQRDLKLGDIIIGKDSSGEEFIQHVRERQTKTRTGNDPSYSKVIKTKAWGHENPNTCPVNALRVFRSKRPGSMMKTDSPFFLSVNYSYTLIGQKQNKWYKAMPIGINHLFKSQCKTTLGTKVTRQGCTKRSNYAN